MHQTRLRNRRNFVVRTILFMLLGGWLLTPATAAAQQTDPPAELPAKLPDHNAEAWRAWQALSADVQAKVDPRLLAEFEGTVIPTHLLASVGNRPPSAEPEPLARTRFIVYLTVQADLDALSQRVFASAEDRRMAVLDVLMTTAATAQAPLRNLLERDFDQAAVESYQGFHVVNAMAVDGDFASVIALARRSDVARIVANYPLVPLWTPSQFPLTQSEAQAASPRLDELNWNIDLVDADRVWDELGITGQGAVVAGFDSGVNLTHVALERSYRGRVGVNSYDHNYSWFQPDDELYPDGNLGTSVSSEPFDCDYGSHGTHTMGTMVGDGGTEGAQIGMAPGARWIAVPGLCHGTMSGFRGDDIGGLKSFQWLMCPTDLSGDLATADCLQGAGRHQ